MAEAMAAPGDVVLPMEPRTPSLHAERPFTGDWLINMQANLIGLNMPGSSRIFYASKPNQLHLLEAKSHTLAASALSLDTVRSLESITLPPFASWVASVQ